MTNTAFSVLHKPVFKAEICVMSSLFNALGVTEGEGFFARLIG